jgi:hypothetical protein
VTVNLVLALSLLVLDRLILRLQFFTIALLQIAIQPHSFETVDVTTTAVTRHAVGVRILGMLNLKKLCRISIIT